MGDIHQSFSCDSSSVDFAGIFYQLLHPVNIVQPFMDALALTGQTMYVRTVLDYCSSYREQPACAMRAALHLRLIRLRAGGFDHLAPPLQFASYSESSGAESIPPDSAALHPGFCDFWISERARLTTLEPTKLRIPGFASERRSIACVLFVIYVWYDVWHAKDYRLHSRGR